MIAIHRLDTTTHAVKQRRPAPISGGASGHGGGLPCARTGWVRVIKLLQGEASDRPCGCRRGRCTLLLCVESDAVWLSLQEVVWLPRWWCRVLVRRQHMVLIQRDDGTTHIPCEARFNPRDQTWSNRAQTELTAVLNRGYLPCAQSYHL